MLYFFSLKLVSVMLHSELSMYHLLSWILSSFFSLSLFILMGRWLHSGSSNMAVLEVPLFSGFRADIESLEQVRCCNESARHGLGLGLGSVIGREQ